MGDTATPLTVLSPIPRWWAWWVRLTWLAASLTSRVAQPLRDLSFIHFAHWTIVRRWPPDPAVPAARGVKRRALLFLTTFDGSAVQYIDAFCRVVPWRIRALYAGADGFPGPRHATAVERYIAEHAHPQAHAWGAHGDATTTMVAQALRVARRHEAFALQARDLGPERFAAAWRAFVAASQEDL